MSEDGEMRDGEERESMVVLLASNAYSISALEVSFEQTLLSSDKGSIPGPCACRVNIMLLYTVFLPWS